jgi:hypothetical protein
MLHIAPSSLIDGRPPEAVLKAERGVASCGGGSQPKPREVRDPARQALRPGREELAERSRRKCRRRKRGPRPKIATVERRETRRFPLLTLPRTRGRQGKGDARRLASAWAREVIACFAGAAAPERLSALRSRRAGAERSGHDPGESAAAGTMGAVRNVETRSESNAADGGTKPN